MAMTDAQGRPEGLADRGWRRPTAAEVLARPLPQLGRVDRALTRLVSYCLLPHFQSISGLQHVASELDPFILAVNHATRLEAVALPALLMFHRDGRRVHFLADWNFQMVPGIGLLYRRSGAIVVTRKPARPRFLNALKPLYAHAEPPHARARAHLMAGRSIGIFPEGTVNSEPHRLLRGRLGAARLSLESGVPVVPAGIRLVEGDRRKPALELQIAAPMQPPSQRQSGATAQRTTSADVRAWHAEIMTAISKLSGKSWEPLPKELRNGTP